MVFLENYPINLEKHRASEQGKETIMRMFVLLRKRLITKQFTKSFHLFSRGDTYFLAHSLPKIQAARNRIRLKTHIVCLSGIGICWTNICQNALRKHWPLDTQRVKFRKCANTYYIYFRVKPKNEQGRTRPRIFQFRAEKRHTRKCFSCLSPHFLCVSFRFISLRFRILF